MALHWDLDKNADCRTYDEWDLNKYLKKINFSPILNAVHKTHFNCNETVKIKLTNIFSSMRTTLAFVLFSCRLQLPDEFLLRCAQYHHTLLFYRLASNKEKKYDDWENSIRQFGVNIFSVSFSLAFYFAIQFFLDINSPQHWIIDFLVTLVDEIKFSYIRQCYREGGR